MDIKGGAVPTYGWKWCPLCDSNSHHTIIDGAIICNAHYTEEELNELIERKKEVIREDS